MENVFHLSHQESYSVANLTVHGDSKGAMLVNCCSFFVCVKGSAQIEINEQLYEISAGCMMHILPNDLVSIEMASDGFECQCYNFSIELMHLASINIEKGVFQFIHKNRFFRPSSPFRELIESVLNIIAIMYYSNSERYKNQMVESQLRVLMLVYAEKSTDMSPDDVLPPAGRPHEHFRNFMNLLKEHFKESREVLFYANKMCITPKHLSNVTNYVLGSHAKEVIDYYVVTQLKNTLRTTTMTIAEITEDFNFPNQSYLSRYFKKHTSMSPVEFKKKVD